MKKLLLSTFALCMISMPAFAIIGNMGHSTSLDFAKAVVPETVEKIFINVKANGAIPAGAVAALDLSADDGATVVIAPTSGLAPVCVMVNACADTALCKCQNYGLFDAALFDQVSGSSVAGHKVIIGSANAGYVAAKATDVATDVSIGYFYDAVTSSGSAQIFIKLL